jgi:HEAT repeat protein/thiol-disulfide isomerase/thioredoxin
MLFATGILLFGREGSRAALLASAPIFHSSVKVASEAAALDQSLVMIVFGADWCVPCKQLKAKTLASPEFAEQAGALHIVEVDVDTEKALARDYEVQAVPTLVFLTPDSKIVARRTGFQATAEILLWLREARDLVKAGKWEGTAPGSKVGEFNAKAAADQLDAKDLARLVEMIGEPALADREAAAKLLLSQRETAMLPLLDAMTNSYLGVRIAASEVLFRLAPDSGLLDPWQAPADLADAVAARRKWWNETGRLPTPTPEARIDSGTAASIAGALEDLRGPDPALRTKAMSTLVARGTAALPALRAAIKLGDKAGDQRTVTLLEDVRWAILIPEAVDQRASGVRNVLARGNGPERQAAALRLGRAGREAIPALAELVEDADPLVVESGVRALSSIGGKDTIPAMAALLKAGDSNLRMTAAQALGHAKNAAAVSDLLTVFNDPNEIVACAALSALEEINAGRGYSPSRKSQPPEVTKGLKKCLADPRWRVRAAAAEITGKLDAKELSEDLKPLLDDADGFVVKNTLEALRKLGATPDPEKLVRIPERHAGLRGEVVELLLKWGTEDAVKAVTDMYRDAGAEGRLAILNSLSVGSERDQSSTVWQPLLAQAATETDPRLRRAAATAMSAQPAKVAAALVAPLLSDEDPETRSKGAGVVLSIMGGERVLGSGSNGDQISQFIFADDSDSAPASSRQKPNKTNEPPATAAQISAWHAALGQRSSPSPDLLISAATYVTGDTNADLSDFRRALEASDMETLGRLKHSAAPAAVLPRLPWPAGQPVVDRLCTVPALFLRMLSCLQKSSPGLADYLLEPIRFRAAVDAASPEELVVSLPLLLNAQSKGFSLLAGTSAGDAVVTALLDATNAAWRAAAIFSIGLKEAAEAAPHFEQTLKDSNGWVRRAAVLGIGRHVKDRSSLERNLEPLLADADKKVARSAAIALLEPETRAAAGLDYDAAYFEFEKIRAWTGGYSPGRDQRPLATLPGKPAFLDLARRQSQENNQEDAIFPALLLAQYGDFTGLDRVLISFAGGAQKQGDFDAAILAMVTLSRDPKYLPHLKTIVAAAKEEQEFRRVLQAIKGMVGPEARELRLQINKRMRQGTE